MYPSAASPLNCVISAVWPFTLRLPKSHVFASFLFPLPTPHHRRGYGVIYPAPASRVILSASGGSASWVVPSCGCQCMSMFSTRASFPMSSASPIMTAQNHSRSLRSSDGTTSSPWTGDLRLLIGCQDTHGEALPWANSSPFTALVTSANQFLAAARAPCMDLMSFHTCVHPLGLFCPHRTIQRQCRSLRSRACALKAVDHHRLGFGQCDR